ncbi:MAG TPA: hypothetical protein VGT06_11585 [Candidatus Methylomirabilis sp.]|jgi:hypothetical protein|nr:hypothetical protein [Candidatus Methylomirabilis sp.]
MAVQGTQKVSLCPECGACPEVEVLQHEGGTATVRIGEGDEKIALSRSAWNTLVRYVREGVLGEL